jgi:hypothetical protein
MTKLRVLTDRSSGAINQPPTQAKTRLEWATRHPPPQRLSRHGWESQIQKADAVGWRSASALR